MNLRIALTMGLLSAALCMQTKVIAQTATPSPTSLVNEVAVCTNKVVDNSGQQSAKSPPAGATR